MSLARQFVTSEKLEKQRALLGAGSVERTPPKGVTWHPYADLFPWIEGSAFNELKADIAKNGVLEPIVFLDGAVLDGRNRYIAARELGIEYPRVEYQGDDPLGFVIAKNLARRHLTESQRGMVAARLAKLPHGGDRRSDQAANLPVGPTQTRAAEMLNVSERTLRTAKAVERKGSPELVAAVDAGKVSVSAAAQAADLPIEKQIAALKAADPKAFQRVVKEARAEAQAEKKTRRTERETILAEKIRALPEEKFGVIVADPEWRFEPYSRDTGIDRSADNHYPTSELDKIKARPVPSIAASDCVLFLWATAPMIRQAFDVMDAWGFTYVTQAVWVKQRTGEGRGTGYWFLGEHELLLVGTRGKPVAPAPGTQWRSVIEAPVGQHSAKPDVVLEMIETYFPNLPKIELNRRGPARASWSAWGNESEPNERPASPAGDDGHPSIPRDDATGAGLGAAASACHPESTHAVTNSPSAAPSADTAAAVSLPQAQAAAATDCHAQKPVRARAEA